MEITIKIARIRNAAFKIFLPAVLIPHHRHIEVAHKSQVNIFDVLLLFLRPTITDNSLIIRLRKVFHRNPPCNLSRQGLIAEFAVKIGAEWI